MQVDPIRTYRDLNIWRRTKEFTVSVYKTTDRFPSSELYGLTSQMRRAAVSMPSNIAEGFRRKSRREKVQFMRIAYGSGAELETQLDISLDLSYLDVATHARLARELDEIMRMMHGALIRLEE